MKYISLKDPQYLANFREAVLLGQAPEKGLFFPERLPVHKGDFWKNFRDLSKEEIAFEVLHPFVTPAIEETALRKIVGETVNFDFPLRQIEENVFTLELFHGPTMAFKDVGARFMSRCLRYFLRQTGRKMTILVATSGDTGGAVAHAFHEVEGVDVVILYPEGKVSKLQELQLTTFGGNVRAVSVLGSFDDCQAMVKQAFASQDLVERFGLTSANSINVARWLSQQVYYYFALQQWPLEKPPVISVPSGNFGNICAGLVACARGLNVQHFIAACNENDAFVEFVESGVFQAKQAVPTVSNAMDVGNPSNFERVLQIFEGQHSALTEMVSAYRFDSSRTKDAISSVFDNTGYVLDPHGAVGYLALREHLEQNGGAGIFLETAHPAKFDDVVQPLVNGAVRMPEAMQQLSGKEQRFDVIEPGFKKLKELLWQ